MVALASAPAIAQEYQKLRYDEDWSFLRNRSRRTDFWDPIKYIPLSCDGDSYLSFGGEVRLRYELYDNNQWNSDSPDQDGYLLERYLLSGDLHLGKMFRAFGQLQSSLENWREGGPRGTDEDQVDVHQLFTDFALRRESDTVTLRLGRQEMLYGSQRLISVRETPNIRRSFDAVRVLSRLGDWRADAFLSQPVDEAPRIFDDWPDDDGSLFWGIYTTHPIRWLCKSSLDLYYLGLYRPDAEYVQGTAIERRQSLGARLFGKRGSWDWNFEGVFQFGSFGTGDIVAWTFASDTGYTFDAALKPRIGVRADVISGDTSQASSTLGTFNALFPRGAYFSEAGLLGPANLIDVHPTLNLELADGLTLYADWDVLWRYSTQDGIYDNGGNVLRDADGGARFIGQQLGIQLEWQIDRHTTFDIAYSHFFTGEYTRESGPGAPVDFVGVWVTYRF